MDYIVMITDVSVDHEYTRILIVALGPEGIHTVDVPRLIRFYMFLIFSPLNWVSHLWRIGGMKREPFHLFTSFLYEPLMCFRRSWWNWVPICVGSLRDKSGVFWWHLSGRVRLLTSFRKPSSKFLSTFDLQRIRDIFAYPQNITTKTNSIKSYVPQRAIYLAKATVV